MALLTGTLYTKKSYGKKIFFGDLVQAAGVSTDEKADAEAKDNKSPALEPDQTVTKEEQPAQKQEPPDKEMYPARDAGGGNDVKVTWKSAVGKANKRPSKDFFTPKDESGEPDVETEKEMATVEPTDKRIMKRKPPQPLKARSSYPTRSQPNRIGSKTSIKPSTSKEGTVKGETSKETDEQATDKKHGEEQPSDVSGDESDAEIGTDSEEPPRKVLETVVEEADEDMSDTISEDPDDGSKAKEVKKPIVIKAVKSSKMAEQSSGARAEEGQSLDVLHPDAIVNIKRELARKGIIRNYEDVEMLDKPPANVPDGAEAETNQIKEIAEASAGVVTEQTEKLDQQVESDQDEDRQKDDAKDGFKTNKSFEIRRLQAKAEREREDQGAIFSKPKFLKGHKFGVPMGRTLDETDARYDEHRKNWIRKKPKSILKPKNGADTRDRKKSNERKSATVRIKEPGYGDFKLYSAEETDDSSESGISQSSSVFGYRPNSATYLSSESSISFVDDGSFDSDGMQDFDDEDGFYRASAQSHTLHDIYDDIDRLNPSRLTNVRFSSPRMDGNDHLRAASADNSYVDRSSLHVLRGHSRQSQRLMQRNSATRHYEEKPLQLFDAMRYSNETTKRRGILRQRETPRTPGESDGRRTASREKRLPSRDERPGISISRQSQRNPFPHGAIAFGPDMIPVPPSRDGRGGISEKEWVDRAQKFFATANAGRRKQAEQRKKLSKLGILTRFRRRFKRRKHQKLKTKPHPKSKVKRERESKEEYLLAPLCYCECCPSCCSIFFCETKSIWSSVVLTFVPSAVISTLVVLALFWAVGIFSIT